VNPNVRFEDVHFAFDKYNLTGYAQASLDGDVTTINKLSGSYPGLKVDVSGHTDWIGTDAYNQALSERRATAVKDYLVRKGVDAGRIRTYAYGESQPVAPNTTAEGRALNRRAEISTKGE
jgi:OOP family OmpA-OmpF porin